jgi:peptidyl-dipeptidase Dcp
LLTASTLPFQAPQFDKIKDSDYLPAFEEGMRQHLAEIRKIADSSGAGHLRQHHRGDGEAGETLTRVSRIFFGLVQADTNPEREKMQEEMAPKLAAHQDEINLDPKLFARMKSLYDQRDTLNLDPVQKRLVEYHYEAFVRAGAQLSDADKAACASSTWRKPRSPPQFHTKLVAATAAGAVVVDDKASWPG